MKYKPDQILTSKKNKLAKAYMHVLLAKLNYAMQETHSDVDGIGIDFQVYNKVVGEKRTVGSEAEQVNMQLKAVSISSKSMIAKTDKHIEYTLTEDLQAIGPNFYLVVVELLPDTEVDDWIVHCEDNIMLKKCAYYYKVTGKLKAGTIKIPKTNILTPETFPTLFLGSEKKEESI